MTTLDRRSFLRASLIGAGALAFGPGFYRQAFADTPATPGPGPYGPLGAPDANGLMLPQGFRSREIARANTPVPGTAYPWHTFSDGQATYSTADGGWILVSNSEVPATFGGGASAIEFAPDGRIRAARRILAGTSMNCAGGPTPWGTWISCEEHDAGQAWECDPTGSSPAVPRPALGTFKHEAACVDPIDERLYLTEDQSDGCFYRFTPDAYPELTSGLLEVAVVAGDGSVSWKEVPSPNAVRPTPTRRQVPGARTFSGGEGLWYDSGVVYFSAKGEVRIYAYDTLTSRLEVLYDRGTAGEASPLRAVDNVTVARSGDLFICEDGDNDQLDICLITPTREVASFVRLDPMFHEGPAGFGNEVCGVVFDPSGGRMYFSVQRTNNTGVVYEVTGPFRQDAGATEPLGAQGRGGAAPSQLDTVAPGVRVRVRRSIPLPELRRDGLSVTFETDEPATAEVFLRFPRGRTIARRRTPVAVQGRVRLRLRPSRDVLRALRRRGRPARAEVTLVLTDTAGNRRVVRRTVVIGVARRRRARRRNVRFTG